MIKSFSTHQRNPFTQNIGCLQSQQTHKCYFHENCNIIKFCTNKKCTLPLCQKCLPIHLKQHLKQQKLIGKQNIITFTQAYEIAVSGLKSLIQSQNQQRTDIKSQISNLKDQLLKSINQAICQIEDIIQNGQCQTKRLQQKYCKINKGSLKTLIFYYSQDQILRKDDKSPNYGLIRQNSIHQIQKLVRSFKCAFESCLLQMKVENAENKQINEQSSWQPNTCKQIVHSHSLSSQINNRKEIKTHFNQDINKMGLKQCRTPKSEQNKSFDLLLKDQKKRLQIVKNKNSFFAANYHSGNNENLPLKVASRSVDNFYSHKIKGTVYQNSQEKKDGPIQISLKSASAHFNNQKSKQSNLQLKQNKKSRNQLQNIKKKYIGDYTLSKEKSNKLQNRNLGDRQQTTTNRINYNCLSSHFINQSNNQLSNRILSRQQIRINIQNRLNSKSTKLNSQRDKQNNNEILKHSNRYKFLAVNSNSDLRERTSKQNQLSQRNQLTQKQRREQFTLNKNYHTDTNRYASQRDRGTMSSIKKETKVLQGQGIDKGPNQNKQQNMGSFDIRNQKDNKFTDVVARRNAVSEFEVEKEKNAEQAYKKQKQKLQSSINQISRMSTKQKASVYSEIKSRIRLSKPNIQMDQNQIVDKVEYQQLRLNKIKGSRRNKQLLNREDKRFNYLEEDMLYQQNEN